ncbi:hypothetical protein CFC21_097287 [Triticum aestivum]|uniref:Uncharacterized protein n=2 Tax=Triticum aestivum TaxID=4565 RepID=A0A3B6RH59_WHEAT|nr:hypothetical protein CFC21_097287 [Triticum aestivum]
MAVKSLVLLGVVIASLLLLSQNVAHARELLDAKESKEKNVKPAGGPGLKDEKWGGGSKHYGGYGTQTMVVGMVEDTEILGMVAVMAVEVMDPDMEAVMVIQATVGDLAAALVEDMVVAVDTVEVDDTVVVAGMVEEEVMVEDPVVPAILETAMMKEVIMNE